MLAAEVNYLAHLTIAGWVTESYVDAMPAPPSNRLVTLAGWKLNEITDNFHVRDSSVFGEFHDVKRAVKQHGINPFPKSPDPIFKPDDAFMEFCHTTVKPPSRFPVLV